MSRRDQIRALLTFLRHRDGCTIGRDPGTSFLRYLPCTCGLTDLWNELCAAPSPSQEKPR